MDASPASLGHREARRWALALAIAIILGIVARAIALGRWPGINGDEAWYGVNVQEWIAGRPAFLHTGVGNPLNPIHSGPLLILSLAFGPSPALLRVPEVIWGILAMVLAYPLLARPLGRRAAVLAAVFIALSPAAIAYSRLGWDPSGTPLVSLLAVGFALRDRPAIAVACWLLACVVHPTNVFLFPVMAAAWGPHGSRRYLSASDAVRHRIRRAAIAAVIVGVPAGGWLLASIAANPQTSLPSISMVLSRVVSPRAWGALVSGVLGLVSGVTSATFVAGPMPGVAVAIAKAIAGGTIAIAVVLGWRSVRSRPHTLWLAGGTIVSLVIFHVVAGPAALEPGHERYALFALVPLAILGSMTLDGLAESRARLAAVMAAIVWATSIAVAVGGYFLPLARGGHSEMTFRTGAVEPKLAAFRFIESDSHGAGVVVVVTEDWWTYWTLRYLAGADSRIHVEVEPQVQMPGGLRPAGAIAPVYRTPPDKTYLVAFEGGTRDQRPVFTAVDPSARPILNVFVK